MCCDGVIEKQRDEILDFAKGKNQEFSGGILKFLGAFLPFSFK